MKTSRRALIIAALAAGLYASGASLAQQSNAELRAGSIFIEAESMQGFVQGGWTLRDGWGLPAQTQASGDATAGGGRPTTTITADTTITTAGTYRVWVRYMHIGPYYSPFGVRIEQGGQAAFDQPYWMRHIGPSSRTGAVWEHYDAALRAGPATLTLYVLEPKPPRERLRVDCILITPFTDYQPDVMDFAPQTFVRFKVLEPQDKALVARLDVLYHRNPGPRDQPEYLSAAGHGKRGDLVPAGQWSAWGDLTKVLDIGQRVSTVAFRFMGGPTETPDALKVDFDIAKAPDQQYIVKSLHEEIDGDTVGIVLPGNVGQYAGSIALVSAQTAEHKRHADSLPLAANGVPRLFPIEERVEGYGTQHRSRRLLDAETSVLGKLGFNTLLGLTGTSREMAFAHGIKRSVRSRYVPDIMPWLPDAQARVEQEIQASYDYLKTQDPDALPIFYRFKLGHDPKAPSPSSLRDDKDCVASFQSYLRHYNISLETLGRATWEEVLPTSRAQMAGPQDAALYYYTMKFRDAITPRPFRYATEAVEKRFPKGILTSVTFSAEPIGRGDGMIEGPDWFEFARRDAVRMLWSMDSGGPHLMDTPLIADLLRSAGRRQGQPIGMYLMSGEAESLRFRTYSALAHGAKALRYYCYGPQYALAEGTWSDNANEVREIGLLTGEIGRSEDLVYPGKPPAPQVAIVYSKSSEIWQEDGAARAELRQTYFAMLMENIPVGFVSEEDVTDGALSEYRACYLIGPNLTRAAGEALAKWVSGGGVLYGCAGAGAKDEFDRPSEVLSPVFGLRLQSVERVEGRYREYYDVPDLTPLTVATVQGNDWVPACTFDVIGHRAYATVTTGQALGADENGHPAVVYNKPGQGEALYVSSLPALTWRQAAPLPDGRLMPQYTRELANLVTAVARHANAQGPVRVSQYMVECGYLASETGVAMPIMNWTQERLPAITLSIPNVPKPPQSVESLVRGRVPFRHFQGKLDLTIGLSPGTDMVLMRW